MGASGVRIDQVLHGYDRGHRDLAASIPLDDEARATMLVLSDSLIDRDLNEGESYLTLYPLRSSARYVLARTWSAGRGFRPGSVWTHSLLLDFQALALLPDLVVLRRLFREPSAAETHSYAVPLFIQDAPATVLHLRANGAAEALGQIYSDEPVPLIRVVSEGEAENEALALALWRQMWPSLRREFSFITETEGRLPLIDTACQLHFVRELQGHEQEILDLGHRALLDDLPLPGPTALREFLARYAIEAKQPREIAVRLAEWLVTTRDLSPDKKLASLRVMTRRGSLPRLQKDALLLGLRACASIPELTSFVREFRHVPLESSLPDIGLLGQEASPSELRDLLDASVPSKRGELGAQVLSEVVSNAPLSLLARAVSDLSRKKVLRLRPEIGAIPEFWPESDSSRVELLQTNNIRPRDLGEGLQVFGKSVGALVTAILLPRTTAISHSDAVVLLSFGNEVSDLVADWILADAARLLSFSKQSNLPAEVVEQLAIHQVRQQESLIEPKAWAQLATSAADDAGPSTAVVGLVAAFRLKDSESLAVASHLFEKVVQLLRAYKLPPACCTFLEDEVPLLVKTWSLVKALAIAAVDRWPPTESDAGALALSTNNEDIRELISATATRLGRAKLTEIARSLPVSSEVRRQLDSYLKPLAGKKRSTFWWW